MDRYTAEPDSTPEHPNGTWCIVDEHPGCSGSVIIFDLEEYEAIAMSAKMNKEYKEGFPV